ncbi:MAG: DUF2089 domain-containing protein [Armatimonadota bacterium]
MAKEWQDLMRITQGSPIVVERVRLTNDDIAIEGSFELPPIAALPSDDQVFVAAFIKCHGSIKQMEEWFDVSYPTIKNRLNRIGEQLKFVDVTSGESRESVLDQLNRGEISVQEALERMKR